jgi:hypothetical protein
VASYRLLKDSQIKPTVKAGQVVFDCIKHDYGCAADDTRFTGVAHQSVTLDPSGDYPFFTVPTCDLERLEVPA